jgi:hypothetical protein
MADDDQNVSIVDVLLGRHQHEPLMKITVGHRLYHNYRLHEPSRQLEVETGGRQRNKDFFDDPSNDVAQTVNARGY